MIRRRRPRRDIAFNFDCFLDLVANVVGIIIRMILVVWVGAKSYHAVKEFLPKPPSEIQPVAEAPHRDPLKLELERQRAELAQAEDRLLEHLRALEDCRQERQTRNERALVLVEEERRLAAEESLVQSQMALATRGSDGVTATLAEMKERRQRLVAELAALEKEPVTTRQLRYRTPVSRTLQTEEFLFECRHQRVTFLDVASMVAEIKEGLEEKARRLKTQWLVEETTSAYGAFRLRYVIERERTMLHALAAGATPDPNASFRYSLSEWIVEPVASRRGESLAEALRRGSEFRDVVDHLDANQSAVTMFVYPDSFELFRELREYLYERQMTVAGRPLPDHQPIRFSRRGTRSIGQ
jgi:hypothetical protein